VVVIVSLGWYTAQSRSTLAAVGHGGDIVILLPNISCIQCPLKLIRKGDFICFTYDNDWTPFPDSRWRVLVCLQPGTHVNIAGKHGIEIAWNLPRRFFFALADNPFLVDSTEGLHILWVRLHQIGPYPA
jgi:hypothetical protein